MKIKRPSLKDAGNKNLYSHLGHFAKDKYIAMGHNDVPNGQYPLETVSEKKDKGYNKKEVDEAAKQANKNLKEYEDSGKADKEDVKAIRNTLEED